jgi:hypothetical protein
MCARVYSEEPGGLEGDRLRIVVGKKRRHNELAGLQIISATPVIHHAGLPRLAALDVGVTRKADEAQGGHAYTLTDVRFWGIADMATDRENICF